MEFVINDYCNGTIFTEQVANGDCTSTFRKTQVVGKCGYVTPPPPPPPPPVDPGRIAIFSVPSYSVNKGGAYIRWTDGSATYQTLRSTSIGGGDNKTVCVDPSETGFNQGWYGVVYYPNIHGVITLSVTLTTTPCQ